MRLIGDTGLDPEGRRARPAGIVLGFAQGAFRIHVVDRDGDIQVPLGPYGEEDVIAEWRRLAAASGLPLLYVAPDGSLRQVHSQIGRLRLGEKRDGRRLAVLSGRRPRFLVRRKPSRLPVRPRIVAGHELARGLAR